MNTRFFLSQLFSSRCISIGCRSVLVILAAGLISVASSALAQGNAYSGGADSQDAPISQEELDNLLAPIALYPDVLLAQVLMAATYPWEVIEAAEWQAENSDLEGEELQDELEYFDWDPSVKSLLTVPQVLQYMAESPRWMQDLGRAVAEDQPRVIAAVQALRQKAYAAGALKSNDRQVVNVDRTSKVQYITIAPVQPQVVYVPVYDTRVVYGNWWWPSRPVYWGPPAGVVLTGGYYWGPRHYSSVALWGSFNWGGGLITINAPVYRSYYRHAPPRMGPNHGWHRPPPPRGYYHRPPPPRSPYAGRSPGRDRDYRPSSGRDRPRGDVPGRDRSRSDAPGRDRPRSDASGRDRPRGDVPGRDRSRGDASGGSRQVGGRPLSSEASSGVGRSRSGVSGEPRSASGRADRSERPSGMDRSRGDVSGDARQMDGQRSNASGEPRSATGRADRSERPERPSGADRPRSNASGEPRQAGGQRGGEPRQASRQAGEQQARQTAPSNAGGQRGNAPSESRQAGGQRGGEPRQASRQAGEQQARQTAPSNVGSQRGNAPSESRQAGGQRGGESRQAGGGSGERGGGRGGRQQ